jgi:hypothetical protein
LQLQGLALLCTAIYQTFRQALTLFHAICVLHLLSLLGFGLISQGKYGHKGIIRWLVLYTLHVIIAGAFLSFAGYIWATAPTFGSQPECNSTTVYVVFGVSIIATDIVFRYVLLALMILTVVGALVTLLTYSTIAACCCGFKRKEQFLNSNDLSTLRDVLDRAQFRDKKAKWALLQEEIIGMLVRTGINVYGVVTLEQMVHWNNLAPDEGEWTFGQVLAIFMLLSVAVEVLNIFLAKLDKKPDEQRTNEEGTDHPLTNNQPTLEEGIELEERRGRSSSSE